jgi:two-component system response regulator VicR
MIQKKVLVIEDEKPLAHALELKLGRQGFDVTVARDGQEGISRLDSDHFDVVLLDLMIPVIDGFHVLTHLQGTKTVKPVIFILSNLAQEEDEDRAIQLGASKFFIKSNTSLVTLIKEIKAL